MRTLVATTFVTLDGVMQAPDGPEEDTEGGFVYGGWAQPLWDGIMESAMSRELAATDLVLGHRTYDIMSRYWIRHTEFPATATFNAVRKYVVSSDLEDPQWANTTVLAGNPLESIRELKTTEGPRLTVMGSWELLQLLMAHELVDEFHTWTFPVVLGTGKRLFAGGTTPSQLTLRDTRTSSTGVIMSRYEISGPVGR